MSEANGHAPRFEMPPAKPHEQAPPADQAPPGRDHFRNEAYVDCLCAGHAMQTAAILQHEQFAQMFRLLPVEKQAALRRQSHALMVDAVRLHHAVLDALGLPRNITV